MIIKQFVLTAFQQNTRVIACEATRKAICIDPGEQSDELESFIRDNGLTLQGIGESAVQTAVFGKEGWFTGRIFGCGLEELSRPSFP